MSKDKRKRKKEKGEEEEDVEDEKVVETTEETPRKKKKKSKNRDHQEDADTPKKKIKSDVIISQSASVRLNSLQSIFASKEDEDEGQFTLFGGESVTQPTVEVVTPSVPVSVQQVIQIPQPGVKRLYFFPHFDDPEKNAQSLFAMSDESFFHNRTEYVLEDYF